ncbi:aldehyde dehydrogenase [Paraburkholderia aromaticivorans]|uniref:aldehyde dehydrogenase n=1 Tax=Paraburkholderia aromaticivorans TaxID=2026199 RepID=UPI00145605A4|nr:aldehyde dehydrogenase [Paraburkholderia aromaticivorans]
MKTVAEWHQQAQTLAVNGQAFINGSYCSAASGKTFDCVDPASGRVLAHVAACDAADVDRTVRFARAAFESGVWSRMSPAERGRRLVRFADLIDRHSEELALLESLDVGKPIRDSLAVDIPLAAKAIRWYGEAIDKVYGEIAPTDSSTMALIKREPIGVVAAVVPWNFPLLMAAWKIGPVLAAGNSIIVKPAEQSPLTALRVAALASEAGIPDGVFNVLPGYGETAGQALGRHPDVDAVTFTGSTEVGKLFLRYAGDSNMKRVSLECGGKSPNIVFKDAPDLDTAATAAAWGIFYNQGEVCNAGSRLLVQREIHDEFVERVLQVARTIKVGDPLDPSTEMGPIVDRSQLERVLSYIEAGKAEGAQLRVGGERLAGLQGNFVQPTVFDTVSNTMCIAQEEIFGPVLSVIQFDTTADAIALANETQYGLAAGVWTRDINNAFHVSNALKAGVVWVNCFDKGDMSVPFGGVKQSGFGRDKSLHALEKYTDLKSTWVHLSSVD